MAVLKEGSSTIFQSNSLPAILVLMLRSAVVGRCFDAFWRASVSEYGYFGYKINEVCKNLAALFNFFGKYNYRFSRFYISIHTVDAVEGLHHFNPDISSADHGVKNFFKAAKISEIKRVKNV